MADWLANRDDPGAWQATYEAWAVEGDRVVATGTSRYDDADGKRTYHNVFLITFAADGRCREFTEVYGLGAVIRFGARSAALCLLAMAALAASTAAAGTPTSRHAAPSAPLDARPRRARGRRSRARRCRRHRPLRQQAPTRRPPPSSPRSRAACSLRATSPTRRGARRTSATATTRAGAPSGSAPRPRSATTSTSQSGAKPYFAYFGKRAGPAGKGWYAYNLGTWRIYVLNSNCEIVRCGSKSAQGRWLRADLAAHPRACVAAIWHHPLFSSGVPRRDPAEPAAVATAGRRRAPTSSSTATTTTTSGSSPQTIDGDASPDGMREFVVGTGGTPLRPFVSIAANSAVRNASTHGVLKLTLRAGAYDWQFVPVPGQAFADAGSATCH